jgi:hypothetical protein
VNSQMRATKVELKNYVHHPEVVGDECLKVSGTLCTNLVSFLYFELAHQGPPDEEKTMCPESF